MDKGEKQHGIPTLAATPEVGKQNFIKSISAPTLSLPSPTTFFLFWWAWPAYEEQEKGRGAIPHFVLSADSKLCANNEFVIYCAYWFRLQWPDKYLASLLEIQTGIWRGTTSPALLVHPSVFLPFFVLFFISIVHVWPRFATTTRMSWQRDWITRFCPADCFPGIPFPPDQKEKCEKLVRKCVHSRAHGFFLTAWGYKVDKNSIFWRLFSFTHVQFILPSNTKAHFSSRQKWGLNCALKLSICFRACLLHMTNIILVV